jgi:hypothetical protein
MSAERDQMDPDEWLEWRATVAAHLCKSFATCPEEAEEISLWVRDLEELTQFASKETIALLINKLIEEHERTQQ